MSAIALVKVGDVFKAETGEIMKIILVDRAKNLFHAQIHNPKTEEPTEFVLAGELSKLANFLNVTKSKRYELKNIPIA